MQCAKGYWNTCYCLNEFKSVDSRLHSKYCKNSFCALCLGISKAKLTNQYYPIIILWVKPFFVTLTDKAISKNRLSIIISKLLQGFQQIVAKYCRCTQYETAIKLIGIKTLEYNLNPKNKTDKHYLAILDTLKNTKNKKGPTFVKPFAIFALPSGLEPETP